MRDKKRTDRKQKKVEELELLFNGKMFSWLLSNRFFILARFSYKSIVKHALAPLLHRRMYTYIYDIHTCWCKAKQATCRSSRLVLSHSCPKEKEWLFLCLKELLLCNTPYSLILLWISISTTSGHWKAPLWDVRTMKWEKKIASEKEFKPFRIYFSYCQTYINLLLFHCQR